ncbi:bifunctional adenosylcobinamide kinase/adenosylcobinamide-phosphate guanylyltransferase [Treponema sp.]|uniref:bifunctional adenosylcobinamide kinase/adenosylcobinamide-phosphate guanylyltransferase n=1 Tax=Treponema sp. TaxID=166 RepID=UPI00388E43B7
MIVLVTGGCKNGKSSYAQELACELAEKYSYLTGKKAEPVYFATMIACDSEDELRIKKHREDRKDLGFETVECGRNIEKEAVKLKEGSVVLFDSLTALTANEMFCKESDFESDGPFQNQSGFLSEITGKIQKELEILMRYASSVIFVSDTIFNDGKIYDKTTELYRKILADVEKFVAEKSDRVVEMVSKQKIEHRDVKKEKLKPSAFTLQLVCGGAYQGKTEWVKSQFALSDGDICVCSEKSLPDFSKKCISHYENYAAYCLKNGIEIKTDFSDTSVKIIICDDIFCGVVPVDSFQRKLREITGIALQKIAQNAIVTRVFCGIAGRIK